jgi:hypothetical protein
MKRFALGSVVLLAALVAVALAGCARSDAAPEFPGPFKGTHWRAIEWRAGSDLAMSPVSGVAGELDFVSGREVKVITSPGVTWTALYYDRMTEPEQTFIIADLVTQGTDVPAAAGRFADLVKATRSYVRADDTLTLLDREGDKTVVFERVD